MRLYAHDYVWGVQHRREIAAAPGEMLLGQLIEHVIRAAKRYGSVSVSRRARLQMTAFRRLPEVHR